MQDDTPETRVHRARAIAEKAHAGQVDKLGEPYIGHVGRVAGFMAGDPSAEAVAWLHDVLEDTEVTAADLRSAGIDDEVIAAVEAITRRDGEREESYLARVSGNPLARKVKLEADLRDNADPDRVARLPGDVRASLAAKYRRYLSTLGGNANPSDRGPGPR